MAESKTEGLFREFYGATTFIEKADIPKKYGFKSKNKTNKDGYPDFFLEYKDENGLLEFIIVVEAKSEDFNSACEDMQFYIENNNASNVDMIGIAISGQNKEDYKSRLSIKIAGNSYKVLQEKGKLIELEKIHNLYVKEKYPEKVSEKSLRLSLNQLNKVFHTQMNIKDSQRSLFFSGLMIALCDETFKKTYKLISEPSSGEQRSKKWLKCHKLNELIINSIDGQISSKINNFSKEYSWRDCFSFIKNIDYDLQEYIKVIKTIENNIFLPFKYDEKLDILGRAYKIFLSKAGKIDNKNIILTPDHIKELMVELAMLQINDVLLDTCTGSGGFLMEGMEVMINLAHNDCSLIDKIQNNQLIGFENDSTLFALACTNMFLHGDGRTNMIFHSSLISKTNYPDIYNGIKKLKPTKCIINPPYEANMPIRFLSTALDLLEPNGKLVIIMPTPTLSKNKQITKDILEYAKLDFIIKMPNNLFSEQNRTVNTSIFGFTKRKHNITDKVLFYNMEDDGLVSVQHKGRIDKNGKWIHIVKPKLIKSICSTPQEINEFSEFRAIFDKNRENFNPYGFKGTNNDSNMVKFKDIFDFGKKNKGIKGTLSSENAIDGEYDFITASETWKTHESFIYNKGEECLVYAVFASGSLGRCHYVQGKKPYIVSNLCLVLKPKNEDKYPINLLFYSLYLNKIKKTIINDIADGTSKFVLKPEDLAEYPIYYYDKNYQDSKAQEYKENILYMKEKLDNAIESFEI